MMYNRAEQPNSPNLTDKQRAFVLEYVKDWNATQAAIRAGYAESGARVEGHRLLANANIRAEVDLHLVEMGVTSDRVLAEQAALAFANADDYLEVEDGGEMRARAFNALTWQQKAAVKKIREKRIIKENPDGSVFVDSTMEYELYDKQKALDVLGKHTSGREKITAPNIEHNSDPTKQPAQQMVELMAHILSQAQSGQIDPMVAKSMAALSMALLKANEQGVLEERIKALEAVQAGFKTDSLDIDF